MSIRKVDKTDGNTDTIIAGSNLYSDMPLATVIGLFTDKIPSGFLYCDDTAYRKADYPELWELLPSSVKDTTNETFTIDLRESTLKGVGTTSKTVGAHQAVALGEFLDDRVQEHQHSMREAYVGTTTSGNPIGQFKYSQSSLAYGITGNITNARSDATTEVKSTGIRWYIKARNFGVPADFMSKVDEVVSDMFLVVNNAIDTSGSIAGGQDLKINMPTPPSGYKYFCCDLKGTGDTYVFPRAWNSDEIYIHNTSTASKNYSFKVDITYIKSN